MINASWIDNELAKKVGTEEAAMIAALLAWCAFDRPLPGPPSKWASHLPYSGRKANSIINKLVKDGLVEAREDGFIPNVAAVSALIEEKAPRLTRKKSPPRTREEISELAAAFSELSGIPLPVVGETMTGAAAMVAWWGPLKEMLALSEGDIGDCKRLMRLAIRQLRQSDLTISAPRSIKKTFISIKATAKSPSVW